MLRLSACESPPWGSSAKKWTYGSSGGHVWLTLSMWLLPTVSKSSEAWKMSSMVVRSSTDIWFISGTKGRGSWIWDAELVGLPLLVWLPPTTSRQSNAGKWTSILSGALTDVWFTSGTKFEESVVFGTWLVDALLLSVTWNEVRY